MLESSKIARCPHGWPVNVGWTSHPEKQSKRCDCCAAPSFDEDALCGACARPEDFKEITFECRGCQKTYTIMVVPKASISIISRWCENCDSKKRDKE